MRGGVREGTRGEKRGLGDPCHYCLPFFSLLFLSPLLSFFTRPSLIFRALEFPAVSISGRKVSSV